jgi:hypothetical protein
MKAVLHSASVLAMDSEMTPGGAAERGITMRYLPGLVLAQPAFDRLAELCKRDPRFPSTWVAWLEMTQAGEGVNDADAGRHRLDPERFAAWCAHVAIVPGVDALHAYSLIQGSRDAKPPL